MIEEPKQINIEIKSVENQVMKKIENYKTEGYSFLEKQNKKTIDEMIAICKNSYYNDSKSLITDNQYDILEDFYKKKWNIEIEIGAIVEGKHKVRLPFQMASMDKIKPDSNSLSNYVKQYKGPYVLSCKLDGVSGLYTCDENGHHSLYTRGDGYFGQNISHLIKPLGLKPLLKGTAIRGEFIISKSVFQEKYKDTFANARNLVSGMINRKSIDEKIKDLHFISYEVIEPSMIPSEQLLYSKRLENEVVQYIVVDELSNEYLSSLLLEWREAHEYEIDGIIVNSNHIYERQDGNPEYAFAFKMVLSDQVAEAKVLDVIWSPSKDGYLKPRVRIEPIQLGGVRIEYATGFNGKFIQDNKIGLGALITMVRSGDVIPYIKSVSVSAPEAQMPTVPYKWTDTLVDIVLEDSSSDITVLEKNITNFFVSLEVDGLSSGNIKRMMTAGFQSIPSILLASKTDFEKVDGFKTKMVDKIYNSIQEKTKNASLLDIIVASGKLGRGLGKRKVTPIFEKYPDILLSDDIKEEKIEMIKQVDGIGKESAKEFIENIPVVLKFLKECGFEYKLNTEKGVIQNTVLTSEIVNSPFYKKKVVMTKTRDKSTIEYIEKNGGILEDSIKKDTFLLIVKTERDTSSKTEYAKKHGIPILSIAEFHIKYLQ
jgi:NAD-dependent DNA ligase